MFWNIFSHVTFNTPPPLSVQIKFLWKLIYIKNNQNYSQISNI